MAGYVRTSVRRREDPALLRGETPFMGDLRLPGLLSSARAAMAAPPGSA